MTARPDQRQFDLFAAPPDAARAPSMVQSERPSDPEHPDDAIIRELSDAKEADWYSVSFGYHPRDPHHNERAAPWNAPSRLFQFPYRFRRPKGEGTVIAVKHPLLRDHPHVLAIAERTGFPVVDDERCDGDGAWQHAVDLCTDEEWPTLLALQQFTSEVAIAGAVAFAVRYRRLALTQAKAILAAMECPEPRDRSAAVLGTIRRDEHRDEKGRTMRPINLFPAPSEPLPRGWEAWLLIHGREDRTFVFRGDHLEWAPSGTGSAP